MQERAPDVHLPEENSFQERTLQYYANLEQYGEPGALHTLVDALKNYERPKERVLGDMADDRKKQIVLNWREGHPKAAEWFDAIFHNNSFLAQSFASDFIKTYPFLNRLELFEVGERSLMFAIAHYDPDRRFQFSTYASNVIIRSLSAFCNSNLSGWRHREENFVRLDNFELKKISDERAEPPWVTVVQNDLIEKIREIADTKMSADRREPLYAMFKALSGEEPLSCKDIAERFGKKEKTIRELVRLAMMQIRELLTEKE